MLTLKYDIMKQILLSIFLLHALIVNGQNAPSKEEMLKELSIIRNAWTSLHPGLLRYNTQQQIDSSFHYLSTRIGSTITPDQYYILLSQLATQLRCGHTYLNPWNQEEKVITQMFSDRYIPFLYRVIDGKFIITHNLSEFRQINQGDEIISIDGIKTSIIIDSLLTVSRSDGMNGLAKKIDNINIVPIDIDTSNYALFDIYFPLFFMKSKDTKKYDFTIKTYSGELLHIATNSMTKKERQLTFNAKFGAIPLHEKNWEFRLLNDQFAYLRLGDFETWEWETNYKTYLDSIFTMLNDTFVPKLIVDIRGNEGGDDEARTEVLSYIANKPFGCDNQTMRLYKFLSISDSLLPYIKTWNKEYKQPKKEFDYLLIDGFYQKKETINNPCIAIEPKPNAFKGKIFLVTNANNSSTTFTMADLFKSNKLGLIIGEPTGGTKQGLNGGQFFFLRLPYSHIEIDLPIIFGAPKSKRPDESIYPDYFVPTKQKDIQEKRDAQIEFILQTFKN
jgi:hypothetical protein